MALVDFTVDGVTAEIRLNRPDQRNAIDEAMGRALRDAFRTAEEDPNVRAVVLTGAGRIFCAGMDLAAFASGERPGILHPDGFGFFVGAERTKPVIAAVNGGALAAGFEIMLACDLVVAETGAVFGLPEVKRGLIAAGGGVFRLARRIPAALANEMILTGDLIDAQRVAELGLVNAVVPREQLLPKAHDLARRIAANAPRAVAASLELAKAAIRHGETEFWALNDRLWIRIDGSEDAREGAFAFKEKRPPVWKNR